MYAHGTSLLACAQEAQEIRVWCVDPVLEACEHEGHVSPSSTNKERGEAVEHGPVWPQNPHA